MSREMPTSRAKRTSKSHDDGLPRHTLSNAPRSLFGASRPPRRGVGVLLSVLGVALLASACLSPALKRRASFDFACPEEQLTITDIDHRTSGVEGCGRKATYVWNDETWIMNTDIETTEQPEAPREKAPEAEVDTDPVVARAAAPGEAAWDPLDRLKIIAGARPEPVETWSELQRATVHDLRLHTAEFVGLRRDEVLTILGKPDEIAGVTEVDGRLHWWIGTIPKGMRSAPPHLIIDFDAAGKLTDIRFAFAR